MTAIKPTAKERQFLRGIACPNPSARRGEEDWWSASGLRTTALFPDFRSQPVSSLAALGRSLTRKGLVRSRQIGTRGHGWAEWRITSMGRGLVADSCIGGGLPWRTSDGAGPDVRAECPACRASNDELGVPRPVREPVHARWRGEVPAHSLPGYAPAANPAKAPACKGSGQPWRQLRPGLGPRQICPVCDAGPATLRVPDPGPGEDPLVPAHPNMVVWSGRADVAQWRQLRAVARGSLADSPEGGN